MIISAFAGVGKTTLAKNSPDHFIDLESSNFKWVIPEEQLELSVEKRKGLIKEQNPEWPNNYVNRIISLRYSGKTVLISMDMEVRNILDDLGIEFTLVYPDKSMKKEFIERLVNRGNNEKFVELIKSNFGKWIDVLDNDMHNKYKLFKGMYISDLFETYYDFEGHIMGYIEEKTNKKKETRDRIIKNIR